VFYTSAAAPVYPLIVDASFYDLNATVTNAVISPSAPTQAQVQWTRLVNVTVAGNVLKKTAGCAGCPDAGAISQQQIGGGDGFVEFTASETTTFRALGLTAGTPGTALGDIKFALRMQGTTAEVRESGVYQGETAFTTGDVLRVAVVGGAVKYSKNGAVFYTSAAAPVYPLIVDASFYDLNATVTNAVISPSALVGTNGTSNVQMVLDGPTGDVAQPFMVGGWAVDLGAANGPGVSAVDVWAWPTSGAAPMFVGTATYGWARPDVGAAFGGQFTNAAYGLTVSGLPVGSYHLVASARSAVTGQFTTAQALDITVGSKATISVDGPADGQHVARTFTIGGWAVDLADGTGAGIDAVHVYAQPQAGGAETFVGSAVLFGNRPDVGTLFGARFTTAGFTLVVSSLPPGAYNLIVYARSGGSRAVSSTSVSIVID
jgi:hypothetical protein